MTTIIYGFFIFIGGHMGSLVMKLIALSFAVVLWQVLVLQTITIWIVWFFSIKKGAFAPFYLL